MQRLNDAYKKNPAICRTLHTAHIPHEPQIDLIPLYRSLQSTSRDISFDIHTAYELMGSAPSADDQSTSKRDIPFEDTRLSMSPGAICPRCRSYFAKFCTLLISVVWFLCTHLCKRIPHMPQPSSTACYAQPVGGHSWGLHTCKDRPLAEPQTKDQLRRFSHAAWG